MLAFIKRYSGFFLLLAGIVGLVVINVTDAHGTSSVSTTPTETSSMEDPTTSSGYVFVDVKGAVREPGVYSVPAGTRIDEVLRLAGGPTADADLSALNASKIVTDESCIVVPRIEDSAGVTGTVCVDVKGAVGAPGVYCLPEGSRINDALAKAGGETKTADVSLVNRADALADGSVIYIPFQSDASSPETAAVLEYAYVRIKGEIIQPGLFYVRADSTIGDVIAMAGGVTISGSSSSLDLETVITPGMTILITTASETTVEESPIDPGEGGDGPVNINTAGVDELDTLYGIGPILAQAIIDFRSENGPFESIEDIMLVPGIKTSVYETIQADITV